MSVKLRMQNADRANVGLPAKRPLYIIAREICADWASWARASTTPPSPTSTR